MTVKEVREALTQFPDDAEVVVYCDEKAQGCYNITESWDLYTASPNAGPIDPTIVTEVWIHGG